jgi:aspartokinase/homoserine dehydrogenase 1
VDGIMTADPRLVPDARVLTEITYSEAAELAYAGAKVLHPRTLAPLVERKIPVWSKNSFSPEKPGTRIVSKLAAGNTGARAVTSMANVALVSLEPASAGVGGVHIMARALDALDRANVEVLAISSSSYRQSFCFLVRDAELEAATQAIESALALELTPMATFTPSMSIAMSASWRSWGRACADSRASREESSRQFPGRTSTSSRSPKGPAN